MHDRGSGVHLRSCTFVSSLCCLSSPPQRPARGPPGIGRRAVARNGPRGGSLCWRRPTSRWSARGGRHVPTSETRREAKVPYVKICGICSPEDLRASVEAGADALGFLVGLDYASEEQVSPVDAAALVRQVPPFVSTVLVTHRTGPSEILELCAAVPASTLQLHGDFPVDRIPELRDAFPHLKIIKAVHVIGPQSVDQARMAAKQADAVLVDTRTPTRLGGTGQVHDWSVSRAIRDAIHPTPLVLAGGLSPENVLAAIEKVRPFGVDVNTGVSREREVKDPARVRAFVHAARRPSS